MNRHTQLQHILPKQLITKLMGKLAECKIKWIKNFFIKLFLRSYPQINMKEAIIENPFQYETFNLFFIRKLKPTFRPIDNHPQHIISPVDGILSQYGSIHHETLLQAKGHYFKLNELLGGDSLLTKLFIDGEFATFYLAPYHYHRVHMPFTGKLIQTCYLPGKLFSVNFSSTKNISNLYSKNERLISIFETDVGPMAVILVGAMIVGSMTTIWETSPHLFPHPVSFKEANISLSKGEELGYFKMGSTVILLFPRHILHWDSGLELEKNFQLGQVIAQLSC